MKGLIFSKVTIEEQVVWPKADSSPPPHPNKEENSLKNTTFTESHHIFWLWGGDNSAKPHWKEARQRERAGWGTRPMKIKTPPQCLEKSKKLGCLLLLSKLFPPVVVRWVWAALTLLVLGLLEWPTWRGCAHTKPSRHCRCTSLQTCRLGSETEFLHGLSLFLKGNEGEHRHIKNNEGS